MLKRRTHTTGDAGRAAAGTGAAGRSNAAAPRRWRRRVRRLLIAALATAGGYVLATDSFVTRWIVEASASSAIGGDVSFASVRVSPWSGRIVMTDGRVRVEGVDGPGGEVFAVARIEVVADLTTLAGMGGGGASGVESIRLVTPRIRLSQDQGTGAVNIAGLVGGGGGGGFTLPREWPEVMVSGGVIELGEHGAGVDGAGASGGASGAASGYRALREIPVGGAVERARDEAGVWTIRFGQEGPGPNPMPIRVEGRVAADAVTLEMGGFTLAGWDPSSVPTRARGFFERLAMEGAVERSTFTYRFGSNGDADRVEARIGLADVSLTLPLAVQPDVDPDSNPLPVDPAIAGSTLRMRGVRGAIVVAGEGARVELEGMVGELPYRVDATLRGLSGDAGFEAEVTTKDFRLEQRPTVLLFVPGVVRRRLAQFDDPTGVLDARVRITRADPIIDASGTRTAAKVDASGSIDFRGVTAAFERFPYRFIDMTGVIDFTDSTMVMRDIRGTTPDGAQMRAHVDIAPLDKDAGVDVRVSVKGMPLDERLAQAMGKRRRLVDALFNAERLDELRRAGLVATEADAESARRELADFERQGLSASPQAERARRVLALPRFTLGGRADVDVHVQRIKGPGSNWHDEVIVTPGRVGVLADAFPYPMWAEGVRIEKRDLEATVTGGTYVGIAAAGADADGGGGAGAATIAARLDFGQVDDPTQMFLPELEIEARGVAVDGLLRHAVAALLVGDEDDARDEGAAQRARIARALDAMDTRGWTDVRAMVGPARDGPAGDGQPQGENAAESEPASRIAYDVRATIRDGVLIPPGPAPDAAPDSAQGQRADTPWGPSRVAVFGVDGEIRLKPGHVTATLEGAVTRLDGANGANGSNGGNGADAAHAANAAASAGPTGALTLRVAAMPEQLAISLDAQRIDLAAPVEDVGMVAFPEAHARMAEVRASLAPAGVADAVVQLARQGQAPVVASAQITRLDAASVAALGGRVGATTRSGAASIALTLGQNATTLPNADAGADAPADTRTALSLGDATVVFDALVADVSFDGAAAGVVTLAGAVAGDGGPTRSDDANAQTGLTISVESGALESGLTRGILARVAPGIAGTLGEYDAAGRFDARVALMPREATGVASVPDAERSRWTVEVDATPRSLAATIDGTRVTAREARGAIEVREGRGRVTDAVLVGEGWTLRGEGTWLTTKDDQRGAAPAAGADAGDTADKGVGAATGPASTTAASRLLAQARVAIDAQDLTPELIGALPPALRDGVRRVEARAPGGVSLEDGEVSLALNEAGVTTSMRVAGRVRMAQGRAELGVTLRDVGGIAEFAYDRAGGPGTPGSLEVVATGDMLRVGGVRMTDARLRLVQGADGTMYMPTFSANCHGGRISGSGTLRVESVEGTEPQRTVSVDASASSVRFASLLADLGVANEAGAGRDDVAAVDGSRGLLDASMSISARLGDPASRRGRGLATVGGGRVLSLPILVPLVRVSNLQLPTNERLDFARADFYFDSRGLNFDELSVSSNSVEIYGFGTASWPDANLDLRFRSRARQRIPVVSRILEEIRDELVTAVVDGPIASPNVTVTTLTGTTRFVGRVLGMEPSEQERRLEEMERRLERGSGEARTPRDSEAGSGPVEME